jgi:hypothetical protein
VDWTEENLPAFLNAERTQENGLFLHLHAIWNRPANVIFGSPTTKLLRRVGNGERKKDNGWTTTFRISSYPNMSSS